MSTSEPKLTQPHTEIAEGNVFEARGIVVDIAQKWEASRARWERSGSRWS